MPLSPPKSAGSSEQMSDRTQHDPMSDEAPESTGPADEQQMLLDFVHERDAFCPRCRYNVRNLTRPVCPECDSALKLRVGLDRLDVGWLLVTIAPSVFSGICGGLMFVALALFPGAEWQAWALDGFGLASGSAGLLLFIFRARYLRLAPDTQRAWALFTWLIHVGAFVLVVALAN